VSLPDLPPFVAYGIEARRVMPGYRDTAAAIDRVRRQRIEAPGPVALYPDVAVLAAAAVAGEPLPPDLGEQVLAADRAKAAHEAFRLSSEQVVNHLTAELQQVVIAQLDAGLRFLDGELRIILAAAAAALDVAGVVRSPEEALRAPEEQREAFLQIDELTRRLGLLRDAQRQVMLDSLDFMSDGAHNTNELLRLAGVVANLAEVVPDWQEAARAGHQVRLPWQPTSPQSPLIPVVDREHLVWLVESPAVPWVPTVREARLVVDRLMNPEPPPSTDAEKRATARIEREFDELLRVHAMRWSYSEQAGYRPDGAPII
jgi:hypothetical protein